MLGIIAIITVIAMIITYVSIEVMVEEARRESLDKETRKKQLEAQGFALTVVRTLGYIFFLRR